MSFSDDIKTAVAIGVPLIELGTALARQQVTPRDAALQAARIALDHVPLAELVGYLTDADRARIELTAEVAAISELGFSARQP